MNQFYENVPPMNTMQPMQPINCYSKAQVELWFKNRLLWIEHVAWTRMAVTALVNKLPDAQIVLARLLRNATDMGDSLKPYYGDQIGNAYGGLIREHLTIAADLVNAAVNGETEKVEQLKVNWYRNADKIAEFLNRINPFIDREAFRKMMHTHLDLLNFEVVSMIQKNYEAEVQVFDRIEAQAMMMGDMISEGIFKQFRNMFVPM